MGLFSAIAKRLRRRKREKNVMWSLPPRADKTAAKALVDRNWGVPFSNPEPARNGMYRAIDRFTAQRKAAAKIKSVPKPPSRQVVRAQSRRMIKNHRLLSTDWATGNYNS